MEEIFHKLPYNAMARSKLVSKEWNSIISCQKFMDDYYNYRRLTEGNHLLVLSFDSKSSKSNLYTTGYSNLLKEQSLTSMTVPIQNPPKRRIFIGPKIVGSYNGLVALLSYDKLILWNPITKKYSSVSLVEYDPDMCSLSRVLLGLCYDGSTDEYSALILSHYQSPAVSPTRFDREVYYESTTVFVYNFKDGRERRLCRGSLRKRLLDRKLYNIGKVIRGIPHWVVTFYDYIDRFAKTEILYFDVNDDKFKQITRPGDYGSDKKLLGLASIDNENELGCVVHDMASSSLEVWVMKEYGKSESWTNMFTIPYLDVNDNHQSIKYMNVIGSMPTGELLLYLNGNELWIYDVQKGNNRRKIKFENINFSSVITYQPTVTYPPERTNDDAEDSDYLGF